MAETYSVLTAGGDARVVAEALGIAGDARADPGGQLSLFEVGTAPPSGPHPGEHGAEWGSVIHTLLQAAMAEPGSDLEALASSALAEEGLDRASAPAAVETVRAVTGSDLWRRALESERALVEVPFALGLEGASGDAVVRGRVDLAFREQGGWVIVDYKTDAVGKAAVPAAAARYAPQVRAYAEAWRRVTGEAVREAGLFFVSAGAYVVC
jgi:ATP-dependent helicase/nuclease subunit A